MKRFILIFLKLIIIVFISLFFYGIIEIFGIKNKLMQDKKTKTEINEGKYILNRLANDYEEYLKRKREELEKETIKLLKDSMVYKTAIEKQMIKTRLREIEIEKKNVNNEIKKSAEESKEIEAKILNLKNEQEKFSRTITELNDNYLKLLKEKEITEAYWKEYANDLKIFFIDKNKKDLQKKALIEEKFKIDNGKQFIIDEFRNLALLKSKEHVEFADSKVINKEVKEESKIAERKVEKSEMKEERKIDESKIDKRETKEEKSKEGFLDSTLYKVLETTVLKSDGPGGKDTYTLITDIFGEFETPDKDGIHTEIKHIIEEYDPEVGNCFKFLIHRDLDKYKLSDNRTRNHVRISIKKSLTNALAYKGDSFRYYWKMKINKDITLSNNSSTCLFSLLPYYPYSRDIRISIIGLDAIILNNSDVLRIYYVPEDSKSAILLKTDFSKIRGKWIQLECIVRFGDNGYIMFTIKDLAGNILASLEKNNLFMWKEDAIFFEPYFQFYRDVHDSMNTFRPDEETVYFADLTIQKINFK